MTHNQPPLHFSKLPDKPGKNSRESGIAYVAILFLLTILGSLSLAFILKVGTETSAIQNRGAGMKAYYLAEAAANHAMWQLLHSDAAPGGFRINNKNDDAVEDFGGSVKLDDDKLELGQKKFVGLRFNNVLVPKDAIITNAFVQLRAEDSNTESTSLTIRCEKTNTSTSFVSTNGNLSGRVKTSASVIWNNVPGWIKSSTYTTPGLKSIIQEIVNQTGWSSGNSLTVLLESTNSNGKRKVIPHDKSVPDSPILYIEYTSTSGVVSDIYIMNSLAGGRYGYKTRRHSNNTFATIATVGAAGENVIHQSYVLYVKPPVQKLLLFVVVNATSLNSLEISRKNMLTGWGYTVTPISQGDSQSNFDIAVAANKVAYISSTLGSATLLGSKLRNANIGIVNENLKQIRELGIADGESQTNDSTISITDNAHYITLPFSLGNLAVFTNTVGMYKITSPLASGLRVLAKAGGANQPSVGVLEAGAGMHGGGTAPGRRVQLPWGYQTLDFAMLTPDGQNLVKRAIEWAEGMDIILGKIYVHDIAMGWRFQGSKYYGQATVWIKDQSGANVVGATVNGYWSGSVSASKSGVTGSDGKIMLESPGVLVGGTFIFTVSDVTKTYWQYDTVLNVETSDSVTAP